MNNTHNRDGEKCTEGNLCEIGPHGTVTVLKGRTYGQQIHQIVPCLDARSRLDLSRAGCSLTGAHHARPRSTTGTTQR